MPEYPREGGFLPDQEELDFNLPVDEIYLVIRLEWGGKFQSKFVIAPDASTALQISRAIEGTETKNISVAVVAWVDLMAQQNRVHDNWKELTRRN